MSHRGELLMLVHRIPYPPDKGDKIRSFNELRFLVDQGWRVHLCALADDPADLPYKAELAKFCESLSIEPINPKLQKLKSVTGPLLGLPMSAGYFYRRKLQRRVDEILASRPISAVLCYCSPMAEYLRRSSCFSFEQSKRNGIFCLMDLVDVDSDKWDQYAQRSSGLLRWVYRLEGKLLYRYECRVSEWFDAVVLVSAAEAAVFSHRVGAQRNIHGIGNGVDLDYFHPGQEKDENSGRRICFCGAMGYFPNIDAVIWFAREVLPRVRSALGDVEFWIVGGGAGEEVLALGHLPGVHITGRVDDVRPYVWNSELAVAPIRIARGIQNKVLEAMALGTVTLATPQAFEGLEAVAGEDLAVSPAEPAAFAAAAIELLSKPEQRIEMARRARRLMEADYSWQARLQLLDELLGGLPKSSSSTPEVLQ